MKSKGIASFALILTISLVLVYSTDIIDSFSIPINTVDQEDDWLVSTPEEQEMSSEILKSMNDSIHENNYLIDSIIILRNGYCVFEEYPRPMTYNQESLHHLFSVTKSFTSALIGIAIQDGFITGVDQKILDIFSDRVFENVDSRKQNITIEHLLTMTPGIDWNEHEFPYSDPRNDWLKMSHSEDTIDYVLDKNMTSEPGTRWYYNTGASQVLSGIIEKTTGTSTSNYAKENLFDPLGITDFYWATDNQGLCFGGTQLYLKPRDMAKFGQLYLNEGRWNEEQIIPQDYVNNSLDPSNPLFLYPNPNSTNFKYGYHWMVNINPRIYAALGSQEQSIFILPDADLVVVMTASIESSNDSLPTDYFLSNFIIPSILEYSSIELTTPTPSTWEILTILCFALITGCFLKRRVKN